ncbi:MAG: hypothetical protein AAFZ65_18375 [Planctomycetota bacterium]
MRRLAACLALLPLLSGCLVAAAGAGFLIGRELDVADATQELTVELDVELVWEAARASLLALGVERYETAERPRRIAGPVDGGVIEYEVVADGLNRTRVRVRAVRSLGLGSPELAELGRQTLLERVATDL